MGIQVAHYKAGMNKSEHTSKVHEYIIVNLYLNTFLCLLCVYFFYTHIHTVYNVYAIIIY